MPPRPRTRDHALSGSIILMTDDQTQMTASQRFCAVLGIPHRQPSETEAADFERAQNRADDELAARYGERRAA